VVQGFGLETFWEIFSSSEPFILKDKENELKKN
jgi:hypothetical protein